MAFDLPLLDGRQTPAFIDPAGGLAWLADLPLANPTEAAARLTEQIGILNRHPLEPGARRALLDALAPAIGELQQSLGQRFIGKPLPLAVAEQMALEAALALGRARVDGYLRCVETVEPGPNSALALQRALAAQVDVQQTLVLARRQPGASHWRTLHGLIALAEQQGVVEQEVDVPGHSHLITPLAAYGAALLIQAAGPHEISQRQLPWMLRWARRWGGKLRLLSSPPTLMDALPLCVALGGDRPPVVMPGKDADSRYLDTMALRKSIKQRMAQLEQGVAPGELQLGDDCPQPACGQLLAQLYQRWCKGAMPRQQERNAGSGPCPLVPGLAAAHYQLYGRKILKQPVVKSVEQLRQERERMATFGTSQFIQKDLVAEAHPEFEPEDAWELINASATGLRLVRPAETTGARIGPGRLFAVVPPGAKTYTLAMARWLLTETDGSLHVGLLLLPGPAIPVGVRTEAKEALRPGFRLPPAAAGEASSLILPPGSFRLGRVVEVQEGGKTRQCRLTALLSRGDDHERAGYA